MANRSFRPIKQMALSLSVLLVGLLEVQTGLVVHQWMRWSSAVASPSSSSDVVSLELAALWSRTFQKNLNGRIGRRGAIIGSFVCDAMVVGVVMCD